MQAPSFSQSLLIPVPRNGGKVTGLTNQRRTANLMMNWMFNSKFLAILYIALLLSISRVKYNCHDEQQIFITATFLDPEKSGMTNF